MSLSDAIEVKKRIPLSWVYGLSSDESSPPRTIGKLEPSYVIRKFLDAQRIHNLTAYLQTLHLQSLANADHTTLLLNCYTKLKDSSKLEEFIKVLGEGGITQSCFVIVITRKGYRHRYKRAPAGLLREKMDLSLSTPVFAPLFPSSWLGSWFGWLAL